MTAPLSTEQVEEILAGCEAVTPGWEHVQALSALATELLALRKRVGELEGALKASERIIATLPSDHIETARGLRKEFRGAGGNWWVSHARFLDWVDAVQAALPTPKEPS